MILSELSGEIAARLISQCIKHNSNVKARGVFALCFGIFLLSISWDRAECFPVSSITIDDFGFSISLSEKCLKFWPILLPFISGFLWFYERNDSRVYRERIRKLGGERNVQLISLFFTTLVFFIGAIISMVFMSKEVGKRVYFGDFIWPLVGIVVFGVVLNENFIEEKPGSAGNFTRKFFVNFVCILMMELGFYYSKISIWGFLVCCLLLGIAVKELNSSLHSKTRGWGLLDSLDSRGVIIMKSISLQR